MLKAIIIGSALAAFATNSHALQARDCNNAYKASLLGLQEKAVSPERLVMLHRWALRAYDVCQTGDAPQATSLFEHLDRLAGSPG